MTKAETERKIKIAYLIIIVLTEKARRISKEPGMHTFPLIIATCSEVIWWITEIKKLSFQPIRRFDKGCAVVGNPEKEELIINRNKQ
jgi:hypothetical protein